jgi:uncharacterized membrane protein (UPF0182 family)
MSPNDEVVHRLRRPSRQRIGILLVIGVLVILLFSLRGIAGFYTDFLWFGSVKLTSVWKGVVGVKIGLALVFIAVFFVAMLSSLTIADRLAPMYRLTAPGPEDEFVQRYRETIGPHAGKVRIAASVIFALLVGTGATAQWNKWIMFRNSVNVGQTDPQFHKDLGFFIFRLPFYSYLVSWAFLAVVVITIVTLAAHYLNGGIRLQAQQQRVTPQVKAHISVLLGILALLKLAGYYLQRFNLDFSRRGVVQGALYTDVKAQLPALTLLMLISLVAFLLFIYNIRQQGWTLPALGVGLWALVAVIVGAVYPAFIQRFRVKPQEVVLEHNFLQRNMNATTAAFGLSHVKVSQFNYQPDPTATDLTQQAGTLRNVRLWDPSPQLALQTFQKEQEIKGYYNFTSLGVDRYNIGGQLTQTLIGVRQLNPADLPAQGWVTSHLQFTHGYGAVLAPANSATPGGDPVYSISNVPPTSAAGTPTINQPQVYYGQNMGGGYVVADSKQSEIDFQDAVGNNVTSTYKGGGGVPLGGLVRRAAFALRFGDINPLISGQVTGSSRVIYIRDVQDMVSKAAPFLALDSDPYSAIVDGRIQWIQDAYTVTDHFPYSQDADPAGLPPASGLNQNFNYVRNSVKVVIDAYSGQMKFYVMPPTAGSQPDPIIRVYEKAFPKMFTPYAAMPQSLRAHLRYPEDLFRVQTTAYGRYHINGVNDFYNAANAWNIAQSSGVGAPTQGVGATAATNAQGQVVNINAIRMDPQYLLMRLPGGVSEEFLQLEAFVPRSNQDKQQNLAAFMVAPSDPNDYGQLQVFEMPAGGLVNGPALADSVILEDPNVSQELTLVGQVGSTAELGSVVVIPVDRSLIYVRPLYIQSSRTALPELKKVIVVAGGQVAMADTFQEALDALFKNVPIIGGPPGVAGITGGPTVGGQVPANIATLLAEAQQDYAKAQSDLAAGNLGAYQTDVNNIGALLTQVAQAQGSKAGTGSTKSTTTTTTGPATSTSGSTSTTSGSAGASTSGGGSVTTNPGPNSA